MGFAEELAAAGMASYEETYKSSYLTTGYPNLDAALSGLYRGGGFASGKMVEIFGDSATGKTVMSTCVMAAAQRAGGYVGFHDHEGGYNKDLAVRMCGLSLAPSKWTYDKPSTFERSIDKMMTRVLIARGMEFRDGEYVQKKGVKAFVPLDKPIVWVFDSIHSMSPQSTIDKDAADKGMNDKLALAAATSAHFPRLVDFAGKTNTLIILLNQIRLDMKATKNPKYPVYKSSGGDALTYYPTQRLRLTCAKITTTDGLTLGRRVRCKVIKNRMYRPDLEATWDFLFQPDGSGAFDSVGGVLDRVVGLGKLTSTKTHITWTDGKKYFRKSLVKKIYDENLIDELFAMLPDQLAVTDPAAVVVEDAEADDEEMKFVEELAALEDSSGE